jgi:antitoxin component YwqK of YwqJK toxin-antitoxin module
MTGKAKKATPVIVRHKDGSLWAKGNAIDGVQVGYWEWFRKDGSKLRSGHFDNGQQTGEWTTYDKRGQVYKVTTIKPKTKKA